MNKFRLEKINIKEQNYYQIISFIKVLAVQLKSLNKSFFLNPNTFLESGKMNLCTIRTSIINSFIKLTSHFTEGAYTNLLQSQDDLSKSQFGIYSENKDLEKAFNNLGKDVKDVVSFDKIDPSLVFFHEKGSESFSIITNKSNTDKEYQDLLNLINYQSILGQQKIKELPNYRKYKKEELLAKLKDILGIKNDVKEKKEEKKY